MLIDGGIVECCLDEKGLSFRRHGCRRLMASETRQDAVFSNMTFLCLALQMCTAQYNSDDCRQATGALPHLGANLRDRAVGVIAEPSSETSSFDLRIRRRGVRRAPR